ncbi:MAG: glycosyltransferase family 4 protein [Tannerellaceae bacterium]|jgi:glycosyltransferase involved in cell wall biosynthesis|nr:glycosyltransferase family 4 protein [Tannerellaceae bacterium]
MKIGFDAKRAVQNNTGLGNYSRHIIEIVSGFYPGNDYVLFAPEKRKNSRLKTILERRNVTFVFPSGLLGKCASLWRFSGIKKDIRKKGIAVYHGLSGELPFGIEYTGTKTVVSVHDLIFLRYPGFYTWIDRTIYRWKFKRACRIADRIIAISECTKRDIVSFFHVPEEKISVVYQPCHPDFSQKASEAKKKEIGEKHTLPHRFLLYVGSIESRKNLLLAVKALRMIPEEIHLVAIGKSTPYQREVEAYARAAGVESRLHIRNGVPFDDLPTVYQLASLFLYPSFFEGFGIPVIEALTSGIPVIAAKHSSLEEAGGPGSIYVEPDDAQALAGSIMEVLGNRALAGEMVEKGKEYVARFSGKNIAADMMAIYQSLHNKQ